VWFQPPSQASRTGSDDRVSALAERRLEPGGECVAVVGGREDQELAKDQQPIV
jgi:hypothetical protein